MLVESQDIGYEIERVRELAASPVTFPAQQEQELGTEWPAVDIRDSDNREQSEEGASGTGPDQEAEQQSKGP